MHVCVCMHVGVCMRLRARIQNADAVAEAAKEHVGAKLLHRLELTGTNMQRAAPRSAAF